MSKADGTQIAIKFTEELLGDVAGAVTDNSEAFIVRGREYDFVPDGVLLDTTYAIASVERHPTEARTLLLTVVSNNKFESVVGELTIEYDAGKGDLHGRAGPVSTFSASFTPTDLVPKPNQNDKEHIDVSISATGSMTKIFYSSYSDDQAFVGVVSINAVGVLTHVDHI